MKTQRLRIVYVAIFCLFATFARARDGQIDVLPNGSTTFVISSSGSYILVDNVNMTTNVTCIQITAPDVVLDLHGHALTGTGAGAAAIGIDSGSNNNVTVMNGTVNSFGSHGVSLNARARVRDLSVTSNGGSGLVVHDVSEVSHILAAANVGWGIDADRSVVDHCFVHGNNTAGNKGGLSAGVVSTVRDCVAQANSGNGSATGILTGDSVLVQDCVSYLNGGSTSGNGIVTGNYCVVKGCTSYANYNIGLITAGATTTGINVGLSCQVLDNLVLGNSVPSTPGSGNAFGIVANSSCTIRGNNVANNNATSGVQSIGIKVVGSSTVESNHIDFQRDATSSYAILVNGTHNLIISNFTQFSTTAGIRLAGTANYCANNYSAGETALSNAGGNTLGTNISF